MYPTNQEIDKVMSDTGMDRLQVYRFIHSRNILRERAETIVVKRRRRCLRALFGG